MEVARRAQASANGKRLFVSGIAGGVMKTDLQREFGEFGHVTDIELPLTAKGVAFVEFDSALDAADAQRGVTGRKLKGMVLKVKMVAD
ncbi:SRSF3 [Symbiodinium sp. CCMP2592]|nr:SRSF3 [Symbiodinium sp. CCMP2592]